MTGAGDVPTRVRGLLGDADEPRFDGRRRDPASVDAADAAKRRLRLTTASGEDIAVDLPRGSYLHDGAVLADDGARIVVVERSAEPALVVRLSPALPHAALVEAAARVGHAFGNQHVPVEVTDGAIVVPITTSAALASETVRALHLDGVEVAVEPVRLARHRPLAHGHEH